MTTELQKLNHLKWQQQGTLLRMRSLLQVTLHSFPNLKTRGSATLLADMLVEVNRLQFEYEEKKRHLPHWTQKKRVRVKSL